MALLLNWHRTLHTYYRCAPQTFLPLLWSWRAKPDCMRVHIRKRHRIDISLDEEIHLPACLFPMPHHVFLYIRQTTISPSTATSLPTRISVPSLLIRGGVPRPHAHPPQWSKTPNESISKAMGAPKLPLLTPGSVDYGDPDYVPDWDVTAEFSI